MKLLRTVALWMIVPVWAVSVGITVLLTQCIRALNRGD
jgi:hypothetical protein